jgi:hypothetical protein
MFARRAQARGQRKRVPRPRKERRPRKDEKVIAEEGIDC